MAYKGVPTIRKRLIGRQLRRLREERKLSVEEIADRLGLGTSALRRQESGHTAASVADVMAFLDIYEVEDQDVRRRLTELARYSRVRGWWAAYGKNVGPDVIDLADAEDLATEIRTYQPLVVPGVFQTRAYSEAMVELAAGLQGLDGDIGEMVAFRERRKAILDREKPLRVWAVIGEAALRTPVGGPDVMVEQIEHLLELARRSKISMQLLPFDAGAHNGTAGSFVLLSFDDAATTEGSIVYVESSEAFNDDPARVRVNVSRFSTLQAQSLSVGDTRRYLEQALKEWRDRR